MRLHLLADLGMHETSFATRSVPQWRASGHEVTADGPVPIEPLASRAYGPAGATVVSTVPDLLRFAALHLDDRSLSPLRAPQAEVALHGWLDSWCLGWARFDWQDGPVWGWDSVVPGERSVLRIVPDKHAAVVLVTNGSTGRATYRSLVAELMQTLFGIGFRPPSLDASPDAAGDLSRFAGVYAWPDEEVEVMAGARGLLIKSDGREQEALPLDERTFLRDAADPDSPTMTFGSFDAAGRPWVLYPSLWGLPRIAD
jgi:Beta-lactamase